MSKDNLDQNIIIIDPFSSNGLILARDFSLKKRLVTLFTSSIFINNSDFLGQNEVEDNLQIVDVSDSCVDNLMKYFFSHNYSRIFIIKPLFDVDLIFKELSEVEIEQFNKISSLEIAIKNYALKNDIGVYGNDCFFVTSLFLEKFVEKLINFLQSDQKRLLVNSFDFTLLYNHKLNLRDYYSTFLNVDNSFELDSDASASIFTIRDLFRVVFEELGAELEFSGKNENERGVIVDYMDDFPFKNDLLTHKIKLGNTLLKLNDKIHSRLSNVSQNDGSTLNHTLLNSNEIKHVLFQMIADILG